MRKTLAVLALLMLAPLSLEAQKGKRPRDRILAEELAEHKDASLTEVIRAARPHFFMPDQTRIDFGLQTQWRVLVYDGSQQRGDSSVLKHIKASEVEEIRYYKPNEANTRLGADNASVIQLKMKKPPKAG
jgi:hypothetical protein